jgi:hypothetical protein
VVLLRGRDRGVVIVLVVVMMLRRCSGSRLEGQGISLCWGGSWRCWCARIIRSHRIHGVHARVVLIVAGRAGRTTRL